MKLILKILGGVAAVLLLILVGLNFLLSADAVRDRVASRVKEQTGRDLKVEGSSSLLFLPNPRIVLTDVEITDPENRAGADLRIARLELDVSLMQLFSRKVDADRVLMERPVLTVRLRDEGQNERQGRLEAPARDVASSAPRFALAQAASGGGTPRRDIVLKDVRIEDGTVRLLYDGTERRVERINANLSLPHLVDPLTAKGDFDWKGLRVGFDLKLATPADLGTDRAARLEFGVSTDAINADFGGYVSTRPAFNAQGELVAKTQSVPSVLAWLRQEPATLTAVGSGEVSSHIDWGAGEISFTQTRFALSHATGQGQAVITLTTPRPYVRAALAVESLNLDAFFAGGEAGAGGPAQAPAPVQPAEPEGPAETVHQFTETSPVTTDTPAETPPWAEPQGAAPQAAQPQAPPQAASVEEARVVLPAAFDADANINIRETRAGRFVVGPSSIGLNLREGVLEATLNSVQLYEGQGSGKFRLDGAKPRPSFSGAIALEGVSAQPLLAAAGGFNLLAGRAELGFEFTGEGGSVEEIKHTLGGAGSIDIDEGAIQGINLTELIESLGAGTMPDLNQGPGAKTDFSALGGTFTMASGVAETHDLEMTSELLKVKARGTVDLVTGTLDFLTQPEIKGGKRGNKLAGLSIPVRIEGPFSQPSIRPEIAGMFSSPGAASNTVNQIGEMLQQNLKGKPVGEAIGRILGSVKIGKERGEEDGAGGPAPDDTQAAEPAEEASEQSDEAQDEEPPPGDEEFDRSADPDLDEILR